MPNNASISRKCATFSRRRLTAAKSAWRRDEWVHLRLCLECGTSAVATIPLTGMPRSTSTRQAPVMRSFEPGENWGFCYVENLFIEPAPAAAVPLTRRVYDIDRRQRRPHPWIGDCAGDDTCLRRLRVSAIPCLELSSCSCGAGTAIPSDTCIATSAARDSPTCADGREAAESVSALGGPKAFWMMHDSLFADQYHLEASRPRAAGHRNRVNMRAYLEAMARHNTPVVSSGTCRRHR